MLFGGLTHHMKLTDMGYANISREAKEHVEAYVVVTDIHSTGFPLFIHCLFVCQSLTTILNAFMSKT